MAASTSTAAVFFASLLCLAAAGIVREAANSGFNSFGGSQPSSGKEKVPGQIDMAQCRALYDQMTSGFPETAGPLLFSPIVKFSLQNKGTLCNVHWPKEGDCEGHKALTAVEGPPARPAVQFECSYQKDRNVCACNVQAAAPAAEADVVEV
eukprot:gnl/TRDRNA2_/TRDRNA2_179332_c0_seq1.p1 gnl/TRDRNA2_/TRDRNA2_179332_c0~~gnl/TRDRNA2_/TRDRNA2_179332_c0_seq1.p1  ORF type:complete len:151 (+),score=38.27 gnl/TRDRNA2_/TRDRNA2_179332_c0_seq1:93-545(+)